MKVTDTVISVRPRRTGHGHQVVVQRLARPNWLDHLLRRTCPPAMLVVYEGSGTVWHQVLPYTGRCRTSTEFWLSDVVNEYEFNRKEKHYTVSELNQYEADSACRDGGPTDLGGPVPGSPST